MGEINRGVQNTLVSTFQFEHVTAFFGKTLAMKNHLLLFPALLTLIFLNGCAPSRFTQDSGAINTLQISLDEPGIKYTEASVPLEGRSWGGFLLGAKTDYAVDASIINNNNGEKTGYINASGGGNALAFLTGIAEWLSVANSLAILLPADEYTAQPMRLLGIGVISFVTAVAINDAAWRGFNQRRMRTQANTQIMDMTSDAHFYCMPQSQVTIQPSFFSTSWKGESSLIAATIENLGSIEGESMLKSHNSDKTQGENSKTETPEAITVQPNELVGATGKYQVSKNVFTHFRVVSVDRIGENLSDCVINIEIVFADGEIEAKKVRASNEDLYFEAKGSN